jgi:hypothetical protein
MSELSCGEGKAHRAGPNEAARGLVHRLTLGTEQGTERPSEVLIKL